MERKKILVVDDEPDLRSLIQTRLEANGFDVVTAHDGTEALQKANKENPDVILLDVMMPAGDGFSVCQKLKAQSETRAIPIIFLTAKTLDRDEREGYALGAEYYIRKPFESEELIGIINRVLESPGDLEQEVKKTKIWELLLVTDNFDVLQMLEPKLEEENFKYQVAKNKEEILEKLGIFSPQIVVVDFYIKNCSGSELLEELKEISKLKNVPVLLLASPGDKVKLEEYQKFAPVVDVIENPYDISELINVIKKYLGKS
ncbi:MAG: response regulator [Candidatus Saelkia tenebricola]|nr:response regulator [Candidatus Saelkia tenebricola]